MTRLAITGAAGRMGRALIESAQAAPGLSVAAAIEHLASPAVGRDAGELIGRGRLGVTIVSSIADVMEQFDVLVDFTSPAATLANVQACRAARKRMVIGTTGLTAEQSAAVQEAARDIAIVQAPNMSIGVNLCFKLTELAARTLGADFDVEIAEAHHSQKKDAPSGTALRLGEVAAAALGHELSACATYTRQGQTGARKSGSIGFSSIRAGDIIGDHTVLFAAPGERIEITHRATSRENFAAGALRAARWLMDRERGLYDMQDVLGLNL
ncbi:MAG: 4-hydroxy-tetrahydrodipicolinate reductase [Gammaproteobacteria bacterium RIFCSPLOWO2_02_FULL_61_13]|nr:MAG: 4-hydroxy-tetrahydrodipicolinate reductase [Gammaproteobacteria bacterium RIFCSPLOWO2_02_FULL_61_13]